MLFENAKIIKETESKDLRFYFNFIDNEESGYVGESYLMFNASTFTLIRNKENVEVLFEFDSKFFYKVVSVDSVPNRDILDKTSDSFFRETAEKLRIFIMESNPKDYAPVQ